MRHLLTLLPLLVISGCASPTVPNAESRSKVNALSLRLEADKPVIRSLQETRLKLTVTNTSSESIVLDNDLVAGFGLKAEPYLSDGTLLSEERDVAAEGFRTLNKPSSEEAGKRFRKLGPGESLSRSYDLSQPIRHVVQGHGTYKNGGHVGFYYEAEENLHTHRMQRD